MVHEIINGAGIVIRITDGQLFLLLILCVFLGGVLLKLYQVEVENKDK